MPRRGWDGAVRRRTLHLSDVERLTGPEIVRRLKSELGEDVPLPTVRRWVREGAEPVKVPTSRELTEQIQSILSSEVRRIGRQARPDLERLARCAQILKTTEGVRQAPKQKAKTLGDLSAGGEPSEGGTVRLAA